MISVFYGDDTFRSREAYRAVREETSRRAGVPVTLLRDDALTPAAFQAAAGSRALFGALSPLAVERLTAFAGARAEVVAEVLRTLPHERVLLAWEEGAPASNGIVWRALERAAEHVEEFPILDERRTLTWMKYRVAAAGRPIEDAAARQLYAAYGANLWALASELEKLCLRKPRGPITTADVRETVPVAPAAEVFATVRALVGGQPAEALVLLTGYRQAGNDLRRLLFWILRDLRLLRQIREQLEAGEQPTAWTVVREFGIPKGAAEYLLRVAQRASRATLQTLFNRCVIAYYHLNTGRAEADEILESLVLRTV